VKTRQTTTLALMLAACLVSRLAGADEASVVPAEGVGGMASAKVLSVAGRPTVKYMSGACQLIRNPAPSPALKTGMWLKDGDVLDLGNDCAMTIAVSGHHSLELTRSGGRYYRFASLHSPH
jgi:hypothetical protein